MPSLDRAKSGGSRVCQEYREFGVIFHIANYHGLRSPIAWPRTINLTRQNLQRMNSTGEKRLANLAFAFKTTRSTKCSVTSGFAGPRGHHDSDTACVWPSRY